MSDFDAHDKREQDAQLMSETPPNERPLSDRMRAGVEEIQYSPLEGIGRATLAGWADEAATLERQLADLLQEREAMMVDACRAQDLTEEVKVLRTDNTAMREAALDTLAAFDWAFGAMGRELDRAHEKL